MSQLISKWSGLKFFRMSMVLALVMSGVSGIPALADEDVAEDLGLYTVVPMILDAQNMAYAQHMAYGQATALNSRGAMQNFGGTGFGGGTSSGTGAMAAVVLGAAGVAIVGTLVYHGVKTSRANRRAIGEARGWQNDFIDTQQVQEERHKALNEQVAARVREQLNSSESGLLAEMPLPAVSPGIGESIDATATVTAVQAPRAVGNQMPVRSGRSLASSR